MRRVSIEHGSDHTQATDESGPRTEPGPTDVRRPSDGPQPTGGRQRTDGTDPWELLDQATTVLTIHAHPDDESLSTGALLAHLAARGTRVVLLTATHGEEGEIIPGAIPPGDERSLDAVRMDELDGAASALGVAERHMLGTAPALAPDAEPRRYRDSGMRWVRPDLAGPAEDTGPEAFTRCSFEEAVADAVALVGEVGPQVIVSYDDGGTYGHPDHVLVHHLSAAVAEHTGIPFIEVASYIGEADSTADGEDMDAETQAASGFVTREVPDSLGALHRALCAHRTQLTVEGAQEGRPGDPGAVLIRLSGGQARRVPARVGARVHRRA